MAIPPASTRHCLKCRAPRAAAPSPKEPENDPPLKAKISGGPKTRLPSSEVSLAASERSSHSQKVPNSSQDAPSGAEGVACSASVLAPAASDKNTSDLLA